MSKPEKQKSIPAMSIKSLGGIAPEFDLTVNVPRVDGSTVELKLRARGMKKSEWAALRDEQLQAMRDKDQPDDDAFSFAALVNERSQDAAGLIAQALCGWQLEDALTVDNLLAVEDALPGALRVMLESIDTALFHGRLGN